MPAIIRSSLVTLYGLVHMHLVLLSSAVRLVLPTGATALRKFTPSQIAALEHIGAIEPNEKGQKC